MSVLARIRGSLRRRRGSRLAILPFADGSWLFGAGAIEGIATLLGSVDGLTIVGPVSSLAFSYRTTDLGSAANELGADFLVRGQLEDEDEDEGEQKRVVAQLVRTSDGAELWSGAWRFETETLFDIQSQIAGEIARALGSPTPAPTPDLTYRAPTSDSVAWQNYVDGRIALLAGDPTRALGRFEAAIERDSIFADAWAGMAECWRDAREAHVSLRTGTDLDATVRAVREGAERALDLDDTVARAHAALGYADLLDWAFDSAEAHLRLSLEMAPCMATAHQWLARTLLYRGAYGDACASADRAMALEPLDPTLVNESGWPHALAGRIDEAVARSRRAIQLDPEHALSYLHLGRYAEQSDRRGEALTYYRAAVELSGREPFLTAFLGTALARAGERAEAEEIAHDLTRKARRGTPVATSLGALLTALARHDEGLAWIEAGVEAREPIALLAGTSWLPLSDLRSSSRLADLLENRPR